MPGSGGGSSLEKVILPRRVELESSGFSEFKLWAQKGLHVPEAPVASHGDLDPAPAHPTPPARIATYDRSSTRSAPHRWLQSSLGDQRD